MKKPQNKAQRSLGKVRDNSPSPTRGDSDATAKEQAGASCSAATNIHDYLDSIGAVPPPVKGLVVIPVVDSIEEAVDFIEGLPGDPSEYGDSN